MPRFQLQSLPQSRIREDKRFYERTKQRANSLTWTLGTTGDEFYYKENLYFRQDIQNIWVSEGGNDTWDGSFRQPKATLTGANYIATENDIINVLPGIYSGEGIILKDNIGWYFYPNSTVRNSGNSDYMFRLQGPDHSVQILGNGNFELINNDFGLFEATGYNSSLEVEAHIITGSINSFNYLFNANNSGHIKISADEIYNTKNTPSSLSNVFRVGGGGGYLDIYCDLIKTNCEILDMAINISGDFYANFNVGNIIQFQDGSTTTFNIRNAECNIQSFNISSDGCIRLFQVANSGKLFIDANIIKTPLDDFAIFASDYHSLFIDVDRLYGRASIDNYWDTVQDSVVYLHAGIWESSGDYCILSYNTNRFYIKNSTLVNYKPTDGTGLHIYNFSFASRPYTGIFFLDSVSISSSSYPINTGHAPAAYSQCMVDLNSCCFSRDLPVEFVYSGFYRSNQWIR